MRTKGVPGAARGSPQDVWLDKVPSISQTVPSGHISQAPPRLRHSTDALTPFYTQAIATELLELLGSLWHHDQEAAEPQGWDTALHETITPVVQVFAAVQASSPLPGDAVGEVRPWL